MSRTNPLDRIAVASPCTASWEAMKGDDRVRFCSLCDRHVYNLSAMTTEEATNLVQGVEGPVCGRFFRRRDGTVLTADCPIGLQQARGRRLRHLAVSVLMTLLLAPVAIAGFYRMASEGRWRRFLDVPTGPSVTLNDWKVWALDVTGIAPRPVMLMGDICLPPPPGSTTVSADDF